MYIKNINEFKKVMHDKKFDDVTKIVIDYVSDEEEYVAIVTFCQLDDMVDFVRISDDISKKQFMTIAKKYYEIMNNYSVFNGIVSIDNNLKSWC